MNAGIEEKIELRCFSDRLFYAAGEIIALR